MNIRELHRDRLSPTELEELTALANLVDLELMPGDPPIPPQLVYDRMHPGRRFYSQRFWAVFEDDELVAVADADGTIDQDNADLCEIGVAVHPQHRRRGFGRALFEVLCQAMAEAGRSKIWAYAILDEGTRRFFEDALGMTLAYDERVSRCMLAECDPALMGSWIERAATSAAGYHLERFVDRCPDDLVERFGTVKEAINDAPMDDLAFDDEVYGVERIRDLEAQHIDAGLEYRAIMAIETATGEGAGMTAVELPRARPQRSYQADTATVPAHRRHGIGRWMKAAMWQWLRDERPDVQALDTWNAESNDAMLAINVAMGFEEFRHIGVWQ